MFSKTRHIIAQPLQDQIETISRIAAHGPVKVEQQSGNTDLLLVSDYFLLAI